MLEVALEFTWKQVTNSDAGDADHVGGNDWDKLSQDLFWN